MYGGESGLADTLVIIPTYNEMENIGTLLERIFSLGDRYHVLVVDDNSSDGTGGFLDRIAEERYVGRLFCLHREGKLGLGTAYIAGFKWALQRREYEYIFEMDADFSHNPDDLPRFLEKIKDADLVVGSRFYHWRLSVVNWPLKRLILSMAGYRYVKLVLGKTGLYDNTGGFKCFRRAVLASLDLDKIRSTGYCFQIEMNFRTIKKGFRVVEIPIIFEDRRYGESKMSGNIVKEALIMPVVLRIESIFKGDKF